MRRSDARKIAETITNEQLVQMLNEAKQKVTNWNEPSIVNKCFTKGVAWNILGANFDTNIEHHILAKTNMIREFGNYLPDELKPKKKEKVKIIPFHQDPKF